MLATVNCEEKYEKLKKSLAPLLNEIDELNSSVEITVGQKNIKIEVFVGGDMKFLQLLLGLNGSLGVYACAWCKVPKEERGNVSYAENHYHEPGMFRTVAELNRLSKKGVKPNYGVKAAPLLNVEPTHYIPDELHLLMRITDILLRNLIYDAKSKDEYVKLTGHATDNLQLLIEAIQSCGVTFKTWVAATGDLDWTSLTGVDKKKLLNNLPQKLLFCIHTDTHDYVVNLWNEFSALYSHACTGEITESLFNEARRFIEQFIQLGQMKREGYHHKNVTPYMHALIYHVPYFVKNYGGLRKFSGQNVEKVNDIIKMVHQAKSNKHDPTRDALLVRKRLEITARENESRVKRKYEKTDQSYWNGGIHQLRQKKRANIAEELRTVHESFHSTANSVQVDLESLSVQRLKEKLVSCGVKTKLKKKGKIDRPFAGINVK